MVAKQAIDSPGATEVTCLRCRQVLGTYEVREELIKVVLWHFEGSHAIAGPIAAIVEAHSLDEPGDIATYPAPWRCDLCGSLAERPWWVYTTPQSREFPVEDVEWLVCAACHELIASGRFMKVYARLVHINETVFGVDRNLSRREVFPQLQKFFTHYDPRLTRKEAA